jgi:hypothetical protein
MDVVPACSAWRKEPTVPRSSDPSPAGDEPSPWLSSPKAALSPLHALVYERLRASFGAPQRRVDGRSINWSLRGDDKSTSVNLLLSSDEEFPVVWVFDPHDPAKGVTANAVLDEATLDAVIADIRRRVRGGRTGRS